MKILHITAWYPSVDDPGGTPFVRRHVLALQPHADQRVWHISALMARSWRLDRRTLFADRSLRMFGPFPAWRILEGVATILVLFAWFTRDRSFRPDAVNFAIAHPNCVHLKILKFFIRKPFIITEHYSAYHYKFNNPPKGLDRIRQIFHHNIPVIAVSNALIGDIERFSGTAIEKAYVIPNVCDVAMFHHRAEYVPRKGSFFAIAYWRRPKRPDLLIEALAILVKRGRDVELRLAGTGEQLATLRPRIQELGILDRIVLLGNLTPEKVADEMGRSHLFLHASDYETYGVVCAEALCCGTPVIASHVGGIPEYLDHLRGRTVHEPSPERWADAIEAYWETALNLDRAQLSQRSMAINSPDVVGASYARILKNVIAQGQF